MSRRSPKTDTSNTYVQRILDREADLTQRILNMPDDADEDTKQRARMNAIDAMNDALSIPQEDLLRYIAKQEGLQVSEEQIQNLLESFNSEFRGKTVGQSGVVHPASSVGPKTGKTTLRLVELTDDEALEQDEPVNKAAPAGPHPRELRRKNKGKGKGKVKKGKNSITF